MRYFDYLSAQEQEALFWKKPVPFSRFSSREILRDAVGALLYIPALNKKIAQIVLEGTVKGACSFAICLEDAVGNADREESMNSAREQICRIASEVRLGKKEKRDLPLLFVRMKDSRMLRQMQEFFVEYSDVLAGVILPKVTLQSLREYLSLVEQINQRTEAPFYAMPILEAEQIISASHRVQLLCQMREIVDQYAPYVLNIRIGGTDFCGLYGVRRSFNQSIYQMGAVQSCIADIVTVFALRDHYTVSAPVWEYFVSRPDQWKENSPQIAGLLREVELDLNNALLGKTAVHPSQLAAIQSCYAVSLEEYRDAQGILALNAPGAAKSEYQNKMNEQKPHALWAKKIWKRGELYGVYQEGKSGADLRAAAYAQSQPERMKKGGEIL